jgi:hypothetical protein
MAWGSRLPKSDPDQSIGSFKFFVDQGLDSLSGNWTGPRPDGKFVHIGTQQGIPQFVPFFVNDVDDRFGARDGRQQHVNNDSFRESESSIQ